MPTPVFILNTMYNNLDQVCCDIAWHAKSPNHEKQIAQVAKETRYEIYRNKETSDTTILFFETVVDNLINQSGYSQSRHTLLMNFLAYKIRSKTIVDNELPLYVDTLEFLATRWIEINDM